MRKFFQKIHLWLSIPFGILITIICLSGAILVFEQEITRALNPHIYQTESKGQSAPLPPSELAERVMQQTGNSLTLTSLEFSGNEDGVVFAGFKEFEKKKLSINPYTGEVNGWTVSYPCFQTMRKVHRWLLDPPVRKGEKSVGKVIVGVTTFVMVIILVTGLFIWVPRNRKVLKNRLKVSFTKGWRRFWYDTHVTLGFYALIFLLLMALTGLTWSFGWYRTMAYGLFGGGNSSNVTSNTSTSERKKKESFDYAVWNTAFVEICSHYPRFKSVTLAQGSAQVISNPDTHMRQADKITFDRHSGEIKEISYYKDVPRSKTLKGWFYAFHTGAWGGIITKVLYFLAALIGGILPLTGYYLWLKKLWRKQGHSQKTSFSA